jgi:hypothetical protein
MDALNKKRIQINDPIKTLLFARIPGLSFLPFSIKPSS